MKKLKAIKIVFILCFIGMGQTVFSQQNNSKQTEKKQSVKNGTLSGNPDIKVKATTTKASGNSTGQSPVDTQGKSFQLDENDAYQGRKDEFLAQITLKELPQDFPKYEKWMGVRNYNQIIDEYYKKHLDILIPSLKQKLGGY